MNKPKLTLLIDDDEADNEYHEIVMKASGGANEIKNIQDSRTALEYFKKCFNHEGGPEYALPDLVFIDINLPALNGFELLDKIRNLPDPGHLRDKLKIFMLTGSLNPDDKTRAEGQYSDLVCGYRIKPLTDTMFLGIVQKYFP